MAATKKPAAKKPVKKATEVKSTADLAKELTAKRNDYIDAKRSHRAGELVNPRVITTTRKEIARLMTATRALELKEKQK